MICGRSARRDHEVARTLPNALAMFAKIVATAQSRDRLAVILVATASQAPAPSSLPSCSPR
jgi:hypothetical protein